jgi:hypothetical protein
VSGFWTSSRLLYRCLIDGRDLARYDVRFVPFLGILALVVVARCVEELFSSRGALYTFGRDEFMPL